MAVVELTQKTTDSSDRRDKSDADIDADADADADDSADKTENQVERLARSGLYINPSDAIKFLSDQVNLIE